MWYNEDEYSVKIGGNWYIDIENILVYKGENIFKISRAESTEVLGVDFKIFDKNGETVANVSRGRIYEDKKQAFKVDVSENRYTLTNVLSGEIICDIIKKPKGSGVELEVNVRMYMQDGSLFEASPESTSMPGFSMTGCVFSNSPQGININ